MISPFRVGLIGLGQIAQGYGTPDERAPYCHAGGIAQSDSVQLVAASDPFEGAHSAFNRTWGDAFAASTGSVALYHDVPAMLEGERLDIVAVCVRGPMHFQTVRSLLDSPSCPRAIFLEKPPFCSLQEADEITALAHQKGTSLTVSYSRHWAPHILKLQALVADGLIGQVRNVVGYCGGTVLSFASHTTDLICQFACPQGNYTPRFVTARGVLEPPQSAVPPEFAARHYEPEPTLDACFIEFENGVTGVQLGHAGEHDLFYADVFGDRGRVRVGMYLPPAAFDRDGKSIDLTELDFPPEASVFKLAYNQIAQSLAGGARPDCTDCNWQQVNEIGFAAIESIHGAGRVTLPNTQRTRRIFANG